MKLKPKGRRHRPRRGWIAGRDDSMHIASGQGMRIPELPNVIIRARDDVPPGKIVALNKSVVVGVTQLNSPESEHELVTGMLEYVKYMDGLHQCRKFCESRGVEFVSATEIEFAPPGIKGLWRIVARGYQKSKS